MFQNIRMFFFELACRKCTHSIMNSPGAQSICAVHRTWPLTVLEIWAFISSSPSSEADRMNRNGWVCRSVRGLDPLDPQFMAVKHGKIVVSIINHWILEYLRYTLISIRISLDFFCHTAKKQHLFGGDPLSTFDLFMSDGSPPNHP